MCASLELQYVDLLIICRLKMPTVLHKLAARFLFRDISQSHVIDLHVGSSAR